VLLVIPSNHASTRSLARPLENSGRLIFCSSLVMSPSGGPLSESLNPSGLPTPDSGGSTSTFVDWRPFNVSLIASKECNMRAKLQAMVVAILTLVVLVMIPLSLDFPKS
jgi:hypothetical protein